MLRLAALVLPLLAVGLAPSTAQAGHWQRHAGYWYYQDRDHWYCYNAGQYYCWTNIGWEPCDGLPYVSDAPYASDYAPYAYAPSYAYSRAYAYYPAYGFGHHHHGHHHGFIGHEHHGHG